MWRKSKAFTLIELLVVIAIIALLISILLPSLSRARELSKRLVCGSNIKGVGTSCKIYANDNQEKWPVPGFKKASVNSGGIDYLGQSALPGDAIPVNVGYKRKEESKSEGNSSSATAGSTALSVTRAFWILVRSGDVTVNQFVCPSSSDENDSTQDIDFYYDFTGYTNISYGYQVPFGPPTTRPREGMDNRQIVAADKGPFYAVTTDHNWSPAGSGATGLILDSSPKLWRSANSPNHGGQSNGEGQNCLYFDGHVSFNRIPAVGIDGDNIYTLMADTEFPWTDQYGRNRVQGEEPAAFSTPSGDGGAYPGEYALQNTANGFSSTDSLIYP